jgi:hypothetical protein
MRLPEINAILPATLPGKLLLASTLLTLAVGGALATGVFSLPYAGNQNGHPISSGSTGSGHYSGVPSPTAGAGLPIIVLGMGAYWFVRRYRRRSDSSPTAG